jgi:hypothetical protein
VTHYVTDTHALIWHLTEDERLPLTCRTIFVGADQSEVQVWIPAIVLIEVIYLVEKSRVPSNLVERMLDAVAPPQFGYAVWRAATDERQQDTRRARTNDNLGLLDWSCGGTICHFVGLSSTPRNTCRIADLDRGNLIARQTGWSPLGGAQVAPGAFECTQAPSRSSHAFCAMGCGAQVVG